MATRLTFLCAGATASSRIGAFADPAEPLDDGGMRKTRAFRLRGPRPDLVVTSLSRAAIETAAALGLEATAEAGVADVGFGKWSGRTLDDIGRADRSALLAWLADPTAATPGGESMGELVARIAAWMDAHADSDRNILVISHAAAMRAAIAHAISAPVASVMQVDIAPLGMLDLSFNDRWRLRELGRAR